MVQITGAQSGLSPPTRGSPVTDIVRLHAAGSIPAHAGEPPHASTS